MQKRLLTNGNIFKRTDNRWGGVVWYMNEVGERKRKSSASGFAGKQWIVAADGGILFVRDGRTSGDGRKRKILKEQDGFLHRSSGQDRCCVSSGKYRVSV